MKTAIITDSNSGITQNEAKELGINVIPMPVLIDGEMFLEDISITQEQFYEKLKDLSVNVSTSQPSPDKVTDLWASVLEDYDAIIHIPMSSGLSNTCETLKKLAEDDERFNGKVFVVDNRRISVPQKRSVLDAIQLAYEGKDPQEIVDFLLETSLDSSIYLMVDTLKYLKKGGRITSAVAMIGTLLKLKPVLQIQGFKIDTYSKTPRKIAQAKEVIIKAIRHDLDTRYADLKAEGKMCLAIAYTDNLDEAMQFKKELEAAFPDMEVAYVEPLSLSVACHSGPGALGAATFIRYQG